MRFADHLTLSREEKFAAAGALFLVLLHALPLGPMLEYRSATASAEPWRLLTAHLVHLNWPHVLINAAAWFVVARLFAIELTIARQVLTMAAAATAVGLALPLLWPAIENYRGFSGVLHALFFAGAAGWWLAAVATPALRTVARLWLPTVLIAGGWIKVVLEQPWDASTPYAEWLGAGTVPQAHLVGAVVGTVLGAVFARRNLARRTQE